MDVEFTVDVIPGKRISGPRVESGTHIMAMGLSGSQDYAFRSRYFQHGGLADE